MFKIRASAREELADRSDGPERAIEVRSAVDHCVSSAPVTAPNRSSPAPLPLRSIVRAHGADFLALRGDAEGARTGLGSFPRGEVWALPTLFVLQGPDKGRTYEAPNEPAVIGRSGEPILLSDQSASRRHAEIRPSNGSWILTDLNSSNGTYLNGQRILDPSPLKHGDQIRVGSTVLVFSGGEDVEAVSGAHRLRDLMDVDGTSATGGTSILTTVDASQESVILQAPETADAIAAWHVVYKVAETLGMTANSDAFLERVADILLEHLVVDRMIVMLYDAPGGELVPHLVRFRGPSKNGRPRLGTSRTIIQHVLQTRGGVLCANALTDDRFRGDDPRDSVHRLGLRSILCVPILSGDVIHGILHLDCSMTRHTYTQEQLRLVVAIGRLAGMAIDNFRLQESRMKTERLAAAGEAVAFLSHHIRNILQGMQGGAEVVELGMKKANVDAMRSGWALVRRNLDRIYLLAMNMLTFSKERRPRIEITSLNQLVQDVLALVQTRADEKHVMLLAELGELPAIPLDPEGVHQVAHNIIINALDAVEAGGGRVNVKTRFDSDTAMAVLSISDNGPGIPPDEQPKVFDTFYSSKGHGGTGLGLAAAKKIVDELRGRIELESTVGEGTTFHVFLPASRVELDDGDKTVAPA